MHPDAPSDIPDDQRVAAGPALEDALPEPAEANHAKRRRVDSNSTSPQQQPAAAAAVPRSSPRGPADRIAHLEARIDALEAQLAAGRPGGTASDNLAEDVTALRAQLHLERELHAERIVSVELQARYQEMWKMMEFFRPILLPGRIMPPHPQHAQPAMPGAVPSSSGPDSASSSSSGRDNSVSPPEREGM
eukprot:m.65439 g.65439  ORF g.65439 m.65439 type:complete len:190 (-) comp7573_c0_seq1:695-1264(-)